MKKITLLHVLVGISIGGYSQLDPIKEKAAQVEEAAISAASYVGLAAYVTQTVLQVNDMVSELNELHMKMQVLEERVKLLKALANNPDFRRGMSERTASTLNIKIQIVTMNVRLYGRAIRSLLVAIRKRLQMQATAVVKRADAESRGWLGDLIAQTIKSLVKTIAKKIPGVSESGVAQGTSTLPLSKKVDYLSAKQESAYELQQACEQINEFSFLVIGYASQIHKLYDESEGLMSVMRSWQEVGAYSFFTGNKN